MKWRTGVCPHCETEYGTYSEDEMDYGEHECADLRVENLENEVERLKDERKETRKLLFMLAEYAEVDGCDEMCQFKEKYGGKE